VVVVVLAGFVLATGYAGYITLWIAGAPKPERMATFVNETVLGVNLVLAANLGAYMGISAAVENWDRVHPIGVLQWVAALTYVVAVVAACVFWGLTGFTEDKTKVAAVLPGITRAGSGVLVAVLGAALGVKLPAIQRRLRARRLARERGQQLAGG
jgi:hypothetical protein